jgi:hypothetical protein
MKRTLLTCAPLALLALLAPGCAIDSTEPARESGLESSLGAPIEATDDANLEALRADAVAANRAQLLIGPLANLVAEAPSGEFGRVYFVESDAGIAIFETQRVGVPSAVASLPTRATALEAYEILKGDSDAPAALIQAQLRVDQLGLDPPRGADAPETSVREASTPALPDPGLEEYDVNGQLGVVRQGIVDDSACPATWFQEVLCDFWRWGRGTCELLRTDTGTYRHDDVNNVWTHACPYRGTVTHRLRQDTWGSWEQVGLFTLTPGWYSTIRRSGSTWDFDYESKVYDASGDGWHASDTWD